MRFRYPGFFAKTHPQCAAFVPFSYVSGGQGRRRLSGPSFILCTTNAFSSLGFFTAMKTHSRLIALDPPVQVLLHLHRLRDQHLLTDGQEALIAGLAQPKTSLPPLLILKTHILAIRTGSRSTRTAEKAKLQPPS